MLPASLQSLKDTAARVKSDAASIAADETERHWQSLLAVAAEQLAPVWEWAVKGRPYHFTAQSHEYEFKVRIPGHREMVARFQHHPCGWSRYYYHVGTFDVSTGRAYWLVERRPGKDLPSYHDTLGAALLAAEITGGRN